MRYGRNYLVSNKMKYIDLWKLQLLFRFMLNRKPLEYWRSNIAIEEYVDPLCPLQDLLNEISRIKCYSKSIFKVEASFESLSVKIMLKRNFSKAFIENYLKDYAVANENDDIVDSNTSKMHYNYEKQYKDFISSIDCNLNLKDYIILNKYFPIILVGYFKNLVSINEFTLDLPLKNNPDHYIDIISDFFSSEDAYGYEFRQDFMDMRCKADISKFISKSTKLARSKSSKSSILKFSKHEEAVINYAKKQKEQDKMVIYAYELEDILETKINNNKKKKPFVIISSVISDINAKYKKLYNKVLFASKVRESVNSEAYYEILEFPEI